MIIFFLLFQIFILSFLQVHYRKLLVMSRIDAYDLHQSFNTPLVQLKISDAITLCAKAWKNVTPETIRNCWLKTGIIPNLDDAMEIETIQEYDELQNLIN